MEEPPRAEGNGPRPDGEEPLTSATLQAVDGTPAATPPPRRRAARDKQRPTASSGTPQLTIESKREAEDSGLSPLAAHLPDQEFQDNVHGFIQLSEAEIAVLDHPAVVRLKTVKQLGLTEAVFPTATHVRREHALGSLHVAHLILGALERNRERAGRQEPQRDWPVDQTPLSEAEVGFTRLAALLHDIGHLPSGHTFEDELGLWGKHDHRPRLELILDRTEWDGVTVNPTLRDVIDARFGDLARASGLGLAAAEIVILLVGGDDDTKDQAAGLDRDHDSFRIAVCRDVVGNTICADLLDYLHRDWMHLGKPRHFDTRLLQYMEIRSPTDQREPSMLAVDLRQEDAVRTDAISSILSLLESRHELFEMAVYHRTKLSATAMLERAVAELALADEDHAGGAWLATLPERLLDCSDDEMLWVLRNRADELRDVGGETATAMERTSELLVALRQRRLPKKLYSRMYLQLPENRYDIQQTYAARKGASWSDTSSPARRRLRALRMLERDFQLRPLSLGMYCPPGSMSTKIAQVRVRLGGTLSPLSDYEEKRGLELTGGHLRAQQRRFEHLWRVHFCIDREELRRIVELRLRPALLTAIDLFVLAVPAQASEAERIDALTTQLVAIPNTPFAEMEPVQAQQIMAHRQKELVHYPTGVAALHQFLTPRKTAEGS